jgi:hypothetical protein
VLEKGKRNGISVTTFQAQDLLKAAKIFLHHEMFCLPGFLSIRSCGRYFDACGFELAILPQRLWFIEHGFWEGKIIENVSDFNQTKVLSNSGVALSHNLIFQVLLGFANFYYSGAFL